MKKILILILLSINLGISQDTIFVNTSIIINGIEVVKSDTLFHEAFDIITFETEYIDVLGGDFELRGTSSYGEGNYLLLYRKKGVSIGSHNALAEEYVWIAQPTGINPQDYTYKIVAIHK